MLTLKRQVNRRAHPQLRTSNITPVKLNLRGRNTGNSNNIRLTLRIMMTVRPEMKTSTTKFRIISSLRNTGFKHATSHPYQRADLRRVPNNFIKLGLTCRVTGGIRSIKMTLCRRRFVCPRNTTNTGPT